MGQTLAGAADAPALSITGAADATQPAVRLTVVGDAVSIFEPADLTDPVRAAALAAAADAGAAAVAGRGFSAGLIAVHRGTAVVQQSTGPGWAFPMSITAFPLEAMGGIFGAAVTAPISQGQVVMGQTTAGLRGAAAGDTIDLMKADGGTITFTIGLVAPDDDVRGTEILMSTQQADALGATLDTRVLIYGTFLRARLDLALSERGLSGNSKVRIRRSWDAPDPDSTMGMARTKSLLGEFDLDYAHLTDLGWTSVGDAWRTTYLPAARETYPTGIRAMCNKVIKADLAAALQEVVDSGLAGGIDVANANTYGGCTTGQARLARITQALGSVSRHSWGQPLDTNTTSNCQGCVPKMDCRIVRIFRKHNFAWGGNFLTPDGMHFEWVGEPRDTLRYPSKYCPNLASGQIEATNTPPSPTNGDTLFAEDGLTGE
ncbi:MAG: M15 family metallopeptidase [Ilumatobacteraceae bacterium]